MLKVSPVLLPLILVGFHFSAARRDGDGVGKLEAIIPNGKPSKPALPMCDAKLIELSEADCGTELDEGNYIFSSNIECSNLIETDEAAFTLLPGANVDCNGYFLDGNWDGTENGSYDDSADCFGLKGGNTLQNCEIKNCIDNGIAIDARGQQGVTLLKLTIRNVENDGIRIDFVDPEEEGAKSPHFFSNVKIYDVVGDGMDLAGPNSKFIMEDIHVERVGDDGIDTFGANCFYQLSNVHVKKAGDDGIEIGGANSTYQIMRTSVKESGDIGLDVFAAEAFVQIVGVISEHNNNAGIDVGGSGPPKKLIIHDSSFSFNGGEGMEVRSFETFSFSGLKVQGNRNGGIYISDRGSGGEGDLKKGSILCSSIVKNNAFGVVVDGSDEEAHVTIQDSDVSDVQKIDIPGDLVDQPYNIIGVANVNITLTRVRACGAEHVGGVDVFSNVTADFTIDSTSLTCDNGENVECDFSCQECFEFVPPKWCEKKRAHW